MWSGEAIDVTDPDACMPWFLRTVAYRVAVRDPELLRAVARRVNALDPIDKLAGERYLLEKASALHAEFVGAPPPARSAVEAALAG